MDASLNALGGLLTSHGLILSYFIIFVLMFIEGPIVAYIAAFLASLGYFNLWIIIILFIFGNQIPDVIIYEISRKARGKTVEKILSRCGLNASRINFLEFKMKKHFKKTTFITKTIPPLPTPGIIMAGFLRIPRKEFFWTYLFYNIFYAISFGLLGYYSGIVVNTFLEYYKLTQYILLFLLIFATLLYILIRLALGRLSKKIKY